MDVTVVDHPVAQVRLTTLRDERTSRPDFRRALHELAAMVVYEASRGLVAESVGVKTPLESTTGTKLADSPLLVPVLRAGLGMLDAAMELLPDSDVGFVGLSRNEQTLLPDSYLDTIPELAGRPAMILDPMLATGGSLIHTARRLADAGAGTIITACVLAAPEGIEAFRAAGFDGPVVTASVDRQLNDVGFIQPGLGDAGDRQFGLP